MRILVIRNEPPWPLCYGGRLHGYELCRRLAERHQLLLVAERDAGQPTPSLPFEYRIAGQGGLLPESAPRPQIEPLSRTEQYFGINPTFVREVVAFTRQWRPDVVLGMNYPSLACLARITGVPTVCDLLDDEVLHRWRELLHGRANSKWHDLKSLIAIWLYQRRLIPRVSAVSVLSETDANFCRRHSHHPRVECIPHGVDCDRYAPTNAPEDPHQIVFWGGLDFAPNINAILFFARKVWPCVRRERPQLRWKIVGWGAPPALAPLHGAPGIEFTGYVDDIRPHVGGAAVAVVPMVSGAGIKNKIMEAWALGKPVLCTPTALGDLPGVHGHNVWLASSPRALADGLIALLNDPGLRQRMGQAARATALQHCSWDRAAQALERLCLDLTRPGQAEGVHPESDPVPAQEVFIHASA